ncbi:TraB/GumN family protein [Pseudoduganella namucuonensis]|uniref:Uncharacterized conserved protein YbaP, TraB family n=1 Tax=Pseudoduganella namucuonensis TaxID=1035707 RepID=A0A1I7F503_9BURK|nr:TraB/GumN family protein [Pseudoduganella namucuonensis]SFU31195.1 Uncharacterized conserved protein YbaP, TraB family [Pseudoduganella namucuonensis]
MRKSLLSMLLISSLATPSYAQTETVPPDQQPDAAVETVVVAGQRPGPGLWKVSKDDHVLWILGTHSPLPTQMTWRSQQAEATLAQSQEVLGQPGAGFGISATPMNILRGLTMLPTLVGVQNNPDGAKLQDVLDPDVYARWLLLRKKYLGDDTSLERQRPIFAAQKLFDNALNKTGLSKRDVVEEAVRALARKSSIKFTATDVREELDDPKAALKEFKKSGLTDQECFAKTLARLETDLDAMRVRANAWAVGDIDKIEKLTFADNTSECNAALQNNAAFKSRPELASLPQRARDNWVAAAERSLAANRSTFALMPLKLLLDPKGYLADLQAKGYVVEKPE